MADGRMRQHTRCDQREVNLQTVIIYYGIQHEIQWNVLLGVRVGHEQLELLAKHAPKEYRQVVICSNNKVKMRKTAH